MYKTVSLFDIFIVNPCISLYKNLKTKKKIKIKIKILKMILLKNTL